MSANVVAVLERLPMNAVTCCKGALSIRAPSQGCEAAQPGDSKLNTVAFDEGGSNQGNNIARTGNRTPVNTACYERLRAR